MERAKYIRMADRIIIFDPTIAHDKMHLGLKAMWPGLELVSAGFVQFDYDSKKEYVVACCYGKSESLGVKSLGKEDSILATMMTKRDDWF